MTTFVELVNACEDTWQILRKEYPDIPEAVVLIGSGGRRAKTTLGHFAPDKWEVEGNATHEVLIVAEQLHRGAKDIFTTLIHEAVHGIANTRKIKDTSGRSHNKKFRNICEEIGLEPPEKRHKILGWSEATLSESLEWQFESQITAISEALKLCRLMPKEIEKIKASWKAECGCGRTIRVSKKIYAGEEASIEIGCKICGTDFVVEDDDA